MYPWIPLLGFIYEKWKHVYPPKGYLFIIAQIWTCLTYVSALEWINKLCVFIQWKTTCNKNFKKYIYDTQENMDKSQNHHGEQKEPIVKENILDFAYMKFWKSQNEYIMVKIKTLIIVGWWILTGREHKGSFYGDNNVLFSYWHNVYMDINICQNSLKHTFKSCACHLNVPQF